MTKKELIEKCNLILKKMKQAGYSEVADSCDGWTFDELDYFYVNYGKAYL